MQDSSFALVLWSFILSQSGCSFDSTIELLKPPESKSDFARSEIIPNGPGVADGQSELRVVIQLMNSDGSSVSLYKPTYEITQGGGVQAQECTTSNNNGVSTCILKSTQAGAKTLKVTNINIDLAKEVVFLTPGSMNSGGLTVGGGTKNSASGIKLHAAGGGNQPKGLNTTSSGFKLYGGPEGNVFSR